MVPLQEEEFFGEEGPVAKGAGALETLSSTCKSWPHHTCFADVDLLSARVAAKIVALSALNIMMVAIGDSLCQQLCVEML